MIDDTIRLDVKPKPNHQMTNRRVTCGVPRACSGLR